MGLLTANELTRMRSTASNMLPDTCNIYSDTRTSDGMGGFTLTTGTVGTDVACKLAAESKSAPSDSGGQVVFGTGWKLHVAYTQTIAAGNFVTLDSDTYDVVSVEDDHSYRVLRTAYLKRRD